MGLKPEKTRTLSIFVSIITIKLATSFNINKTKSTLGNQFKTQ